jgi:hypothetical protein
MSFYYNYSFKFDSLSILTGPHFKIFEILRLIMKNNKTILNFIRFNFFLIYFTDSRRRSKGKDSKWASQSDDPEPKLRRTERSRSKWSRPKRSWSERSRPKWSQKVRTRFEPARLRGRMDERSTVEDCAKNNLGSDRRQQTIHLGTKGTFLFKFSVTTFY